MAEYIKENKAHLAELVAFESEGYTARINFDDPAAPSHEPVMFEEEPEEDQKALNDMLHENYCLRLRCVGVGGRRFSSGNVLTRNTPNRPITDSPAT
jgi:hypothetical protein